MSEPATIFEIHGGPQETIRGVYAKGGLSAPRGSVVVGWLISPRDDETNEAFQARVRDLMNAVLSLDRDHGGEETVFGSICVVEGRR